MENNQFEVKIDNLDNSEVLENNDNNDNTEVIQENHENLEPTIEELQEKFSNYKKSYKKAGACVLWWFVIMNVLCTITMGIGVAFLFVNYLVKHGTASLNLSNPLELFDILKAEGNFYIIPLLYLIGDFASGIIAYFIARKIVYGKGFVKEEKRIRKLNKKEICIYILMAFGLWGVGAVVGNLPEFFGLAKSSQEIEMIFGGNEIFYVILAIIGGPIFEELIFRKAFIDATSRWGEALSVLVSSLFFGLVHGNCGQFFLAFLIGLLFGIIYIKTKNVLYTMGLHFMINTWASVTTVTSLIGGNVARVGDLVWNIVTLVLIIAGVIVLILWKKSELLRVENKNEYDGKIVLRNGMILTLLIIFIGLLSFTELTGLISWFSVGIRQHIISLKYIVLLVPISAFIYCIVKIFKGISTKFPMSK